MIVNREHTEATISANVETYSGGIAFNAETFSIIISGIYKDKLLAAVREPIFNALDSHTQAKKAATEILIHSPSDLEPWFSVEDKGLGMDKEMVTKLFMTLGSSTKRDSNEVVGAKGIGSKAPFAYTDMFTVNSTFDGVRTSYSVYKDRGIPKIAVLNSCETADCNGVEIKFSVEPSQVSAVRRALLKCLTYVDSPYVINDPYVRDMIEEAKPECYFRRDIGDWRVEFYKPREGHENVVVMGQQPYVSEALKDLPPCAVFVPIGTCDVSPGREYTEEGEEDGGFSEKLRTVVKNISDAIGEEIIKGLNKTSNILEARDYLRDNVQGYFASRYGYTWLRDKMFDVMGSANAISSFSYKKSSYRRGFCPDHDAKLTPLELLRIPVVLFADKRSSLKRRAAYLSDKYNQDRIYIVEADGDGALLAKHDFFKPLFVYATSFNAPKLKQERAARSGNIRVCVYERDGAGYEQWVNKADLADVEYYMIKAAKNQGDATWVGDFRSSAAFVAKEFDNLGVQADEIWLVTCTAAAYLPKTAKAVQKDDWIANTKEGYRNWYIRHHLETVVNNKRAMRKLFGIKTLPLKKETGGYPHRLGRWKGPEHLHDTTEAIKVLAKIRARYEGRLAKHKEEALAKYPLLKHVGFRNWKSPEFLEYRGLIDGKGEK